MIYSQTLLPDGPASAPFPEAWREHDWRASPAARALARAFTPPPAMEIWEWADENVRLQNEDAAEPGEYRSTKTPWTRRLQELWRHPWMWMYDYRAEKWTRVRVREVAVQKSSQSGFSEACMNGIRWDASFRPKNTIYAIDSADEAKKIARRLLRSLKFLDPAIFTGDPNDVKTQEFKLRGMELLFYGSGSEGKFANKQAPRRVNDEFEEHQMGNTADNLESRGKTSQGGGFQVNLSKPKLKDGPINRAFISGNQEELFVPCPHCGLMQPLTFFPEELDVPFTAEVDEIRDEQTGEIVARMPHPLPLGERRKFRTGRVVFDHCKDALGGWDQLRILQDTYYECAAGCRIDEGHKRWMLDHLDWRPMVFNGSPGVVSQHFSDLYSEEDSVTWGQLVIKWLKLKRKGTEGMKEFYNHYLGKAWSEAANTTEPRDILANMAGKPLWFVDAANSEGQMVRHVFSDEPSASQMAAGNAARGLTTPVIFSACPPYRRGTIPFDPYRVRKDTGGTLILGADVGGNYAKWVVVAVHKNLRDLAVIDWGPELDPDSINLLACSRTWPVTLTGEKCRVASGWIDAHFRPTDVYKACLASRGILRPLVAVGGAMARTVKLFSFNHVSTYHERFRKLDVNAQRCKDALYIERLKRKRKRLWFPVDVEEDQDFIDELCAERQVEDKRGNWSWDDEPSGPNHFGDALSYAIAGFDFLTRQTRATEASADPLTSQESSSEDNG